MASYKAFVVSGFLLVTITIVVQSVPIGKAKQTIQLSSENNKKADDSDKPTSTTTISTTTSTTTQSSSTTPEKNDNKKKRYIDDDQLDRFFDSESNELDYKNKIHQTLHAKVQETSAKVHDNADKPVNTDDSKIFSDIKMTPNELTNVVRKRRNVKLIDESNRRRKRALSPYNFYDTNSFYDPYADLIERPSRSFAPIYWYPTAYERNIRAALAPSYYQSSEWPSLYSSTIDDDDDDDDENEIPTLVYDDENDYESNRYPILLPSSNNNPFDNFQLQGRYNTDDLPIDEDVEEDDDDDDGEYRLFYERQSPYYNRYEPNELDF